MSSLARLPLHKIHILRDIQTYINLINRIKYFFQQNTVKMICQASIAHELINQHELAFFNTIPDQIHKIPVMKFTEQNHLHQVESTIKL